MSKIMLTRRLNPNPQIPDDHEYCPEVDAILRKYLHDYTFQDVSHCSIYDPICYADGCPFGMCSKISMLVDMGVSKIWRQKDSEFCDDSVNLLNSIDDFLYLFKQLKITVKDIDPLP